VRCPTRTRKGETAWSRLPHVHRARVRRWLDRRRLQSESSLCAGAAGPRGPLHAGGPPDASLERQAVVALFPPDQKRCAPTPDCARGRGPCSEVRRGVEALAALGAGRPGLRWGPRRWKQRVCLRTAPRCRSRGSVVPCQAPVSSGSLTVLADSMSGLARGAIEPRDVASGISGAGAVLWRRRPGSLAVLRPKPGIGPCGPSP